MKKGKLNQLLSMTLAVSMTFGMTSLPAFADAGDDAAGAVSAGTEAGIAAGEADGEAAAEDSLVTEDVSAAATEAETDAAVSEETAADSGVLQETVPAADQEISSEETAAESESACTEEADVYVPAADTGDVPVQEAAEYAEEESETVSDDPALAGEEEAYKYVSMNVPYRVFYQAYGLTDMAVWEVEPGIDAVSTATTDKFKGTTGLAKGTYNNGKYIMGVTIPVQVDSETYQTLNKDLTVNDSYYFTDLEKVPDVYSVLTVTDGVWSFSKMQDAPFSSAYVSVGEVDLSQSYGDYVIPLKGFTNANSSVQVSETEALPYTIYGAVINTADGKSFGMTCLENLWYGSRVTNAEIAVSIPGGKGEKRGHGRGDEFYQFEGLNGAELTEIDVITDLGIIKVPANGTVLTKYYTGNLNDLSMSVTADSTELTITGIPEELTNVKVTVSGNGGKTRLANKAEIVDGKVALSEKPADGILYTVTISSDFSDITRTVSTPISAAQKEELQDRITRAEAAAGYAENADLQAHVQEAKDMIASDSATSYEAATLIGELDEKIKNTYPAVEFESASLRGKVFEIALKDIQLTDLGNPTYSITSRSGRRIITLASGALTGNTIVLDTAAEAGKEYTLTIVSDNYRDSSTNITAAAVQGMAKTAVGGINYYYADTKDVDAAAYYQVEVKTGRGANAKTTYTFYTKDELKQAGESSIYYTAAPGAAELTGTLYGYKDGTPTTYANVYNGLGVQTDSSYDAISSATHFTGHHAKDIPSLVTYGTDEEGNKYINGLNLGRTAATVDAAAYVEGSILKEAGENLSAEQEAALAVTLKTNPMNPPAKNTIKPVLKSATFTTVSSYGTGEFDIVPDDTVEGYVWDEYWSSVYAATISDGTTTVGAVHWIDLYGEGTSGNTGSPHYNKIQIALNNGKTPAKNEAEVSRYAAFYDEASGEVKDGTYTVKIYAEGYDVLEASVKVTTAEDKAAVENVRALIEKAGGKFASAAEAQKAVEAAQKAYAALTESQKALLKGVTDPEKALSDAQKAADSQKTAEKKAAEEAAKKKAAEEAAKKKAAKEAAKKAAQKTQKVKKVTPASKTFKASKLKKKNQTFKLKAKISGKGTVTFKKVFGNSKIKISKSGKVTVKKKLKKGTYKVKVKVSIAKTGNYKAASKNVTIKIKVK